MSKMPDRFGRFEIIERLGAGAFGVVFKARDPILRRFVALKLPSLRTFVSEELIERFVQEAKIAARLDHPNIVRLLEADRVGEIWYLVSDFIDGPNLAEWLHQQPTLPSPHVAARLSQDVAGAVAYANSQGIIHRDLKPANILMARADGEARVGWQLRITDFGLAKFVDPSASVADLTKTGQWVGTPSYMAPEQIDGKSELMTPLTDVYGIGAVLYDLLTGRAPFSGTSSHEIMSKVKGMDPVRPRLVHRSIPEDLETICLKCLEKDPAKRYASAKQVQEELQRFLDGRPILARPVSPAARAVKWVRRNPTAATLLATVAFSLIAIAGGASYYAIEQTRLNRKLEVALGNERVALQKSEQLIYAADMRIVSDELGNGQIAAAVDHLQRHIPKEGETDRRGIEWQVAWNQTHDWDRRLLGHQGGVHAITFTPNGQALISVGADKLVRFWNTSTWKLEDAVSGHEAEINELAISNDGKLLFTGDDLGVLGVWDIASRKLVRTIASGLSRIGSLCWCDQVQRVAAVGWTSKLVLIDPQTAQVETYDLPSPTLRAVAADEQATKFLAVGDLAGDISLFHLGDRALWRKWHAHEGQIHALRFRAGLYSTSADYAVKLWEATKQELLTSTLLPQDVHGIAIAENSSFLLAATKNRILHRVDHPWSPHTPKAAYPVARGHQDRVWSVAIHPHGTCFASADRSGEIQIRDLLIGTRRNEFRLPGVMVRRVGFSPDERYLAVIDQRSDSKNVLHLFDTTTGMEVLQLAATHVPEQVILEDGANLCFSQDSSLLAFNGGSGIRVVDLPSRQFRQLGSPTSPIHAWIQCFSTDARFLYLNGADTVYRCPIDSGDTTPIARHMLLATWNQDGKDWMLRRGEAYRVVAEPVDQSSAAIELVGMTEMVISAAISPDRRLVAAGGIDRSVRVWDLPSQRLLHTFVGHQGSIHQLRFTPDSSRLFSFSGQDKTVRCWELASQQEVMRLGGPTEQISSFDLAADGTQMVVGYMGTGQSRVEFIPLTNDRKQTSPVVRFDRLANNTIETHPSVPAPLTFQLDQPLGPSTGLVRTAALSPSSKLAAFGDGDGTVILRETSTWKTIFEAQINSLAADSLAFSPDEKQLAVGHEDGLVGIINLDSSPSYSFLPCFPPRVSCIQFSPRGQYLGVGNSDGSLFLSDVPKKQNLPSITLDGEITKIEFLAGSTNLVAATRDGWVVVWNWEKNEVVAKINMHRQVTDLAILPDQETVLAPARSHFYKWHYPTGRVDRLVTTTYGGYRTIDLMQDGQTAFCLALGGAKLKMLNVSTLEQQAFSSGLSFPAHELLWNQRTGVTILINRQSSVSPKAVMGGRILQEDAQLASNSDEALTAFKPTIDDRVRDQASIWSFDERATAIAADGSRSLPAVEALLRSIHQYARQNGFLAALPVVWPSDWTPEIPFDIALLKQGAGEVVEPTANEFWAHDVEAIITMNGHLGGIQERGRIASSFASRHQRRGAIPLYSEKPDASGKVLYPTLLLGESDVVREVDLNDLGYPMTTLTTIAAAHAYAIKNGFGTGIPTFARTAPNVIVRLPIILFPRDVVDIRSVTISDLLRQRLD